MKLAAGWRGSAQTQCQEGRVTFQHILTYTLNSIVKKVVAVLFRKRHA